MPKIKETHPTNQGIPWDSPPFHNNLRHGLVVRDNSVTRIRFHEPYDDGDVVSDTLERHRDCDVGLEGVDGSTVVVSESGGFGFEGEEVMTEYKDEAAPKIYSSLDLYSLITEIPARPKPLVLLKYNYKPIVFTFSALKSTPINLACFISSKKGPDCDF
ncbi:hypothetical protein V6N11_010974 [Hibiscus sabdariffa]|uniref:Uncharacterized protein n=1 Tax=Hibiscus sabdariffa TaxID=183260 RepID=A0ABR2S7M3_9ROSI